MSPYREAPVAPEPRARRTVPFPWRKAVCYAIALATLGPFVLEIGPGWVRWLVPFGVVAWIIGLQPEATSDAKARLCRILWNCGQRGTAVGVSIGWIPLRLSQKRMDRNARAVQRFVQQRRRERYPWIKD